MFLPFSLENVFVLENVELLGTRGLKGDFFLSSSLLLVSSSESTCLKPSDGCTDVLPLNMSTRGQVLATPYVYTRTPYVYTRRRQRSTTKALLLRTPAILALASRSNLDESEDLLRCLRWFL